MSAPGEKPTLADTIPGTMLAMVTRPKRKSVEAGVVVATVAPGKVDAINAHPATPVVAGGFRIVAMAFSVQPIWFTVDKSGKLVLTVLVLSGTIRIVIGVAGFLCLPGLAATLSGGIEMASTGLSKAIRLWREFRAPPAPPAP